MAGDVQSQPVKVDGMVYCHSGPATPAISINLTIDVIKMPKGLNKLRDVIGVCGFH